MRKLEEIRTILSQVKSLVQAKYQISELGIFGDYVKGEVQENSKVNILIDYREPPSLLDLVDMEYYLSNIFVYFEINHLIFKYPFRYEIGIEKSH